MGDITSEVEMVEKLQNQEIYITIRPDHQAEHQESRENIEFLKEKIFKKNSALDQDLEFKKINANRDVMLAKAVDALSLKRSLKHKIESFSKSYMEEKDKDFFVKSLKTIPKAATFVKSRHVKCVELFCQSKWHFP